MNRFPLIALLALLLLACKKDKASDPTPAQPQLPPATQTGANTFACYVNGKPFIQERRPFTPIVGTQLTQNSLTGKYYLSVDASMRKVDTLFPYNIFVLFEFFPIISNKYGIKDLKNRLWSGGGGFRYPWRTESMKPDRDTGWVIIDYLDTTKRIIAGRFEFSLTDREQRVYNIKDGRFDCYYTY